MMLKSLHVENFKGFQDFSADFTPITIFGGKNNCGKTSILEALYLRFFYANINCFPVLNSLRHVRDINGFTPERCWKPLFYNFDISKNLKVAVFNDKDECSELSLNLDNNFIMPQNVINTMPPMVNSNGVGNSYALKFNLTSPFLDEKGQFIINNSGMSCHITEHKEKRSLQAQTTFFFKYDYWFDQNMLAQWFGNLLLNGRKKYVVECMKLFDSNIEDLQIVMHDGFGYLYAFFADGRKMPVNYMGDGMNRLMNLTMCILANANSILLVDEIENGFHYSMYPKVWEVLGKAAKINNCQIIANTHSAGMLQGAVDGLKAIDRVEDMSYVRLGRTESAVKPYTFTSEMLDYALASEMEVR